MEPLDKDIVQVWNRMESQFPHIAILSSPDNRDPLCIQGKNEWLDQNLGPRQLRLFKSEKYVYACPQSILVDDLTKNTQPWEEHGGKAILFQGKFDEQFWSTLTNISMFL